MQTPKTGKDEKASARVDLAVRERLIRAAIDTFARLGFDGASLRTIAQQAGVAFQLITYHFGSKEDLWAAAVNRLFEERRTATRTSFSAARDYEAQLRAWLETAIAFHGERPELRQILCQEYMAGSSRYERTLRPVLREAAPASAFIFEQARHLQVRTALSCEEIQLVLRGILVTIAVAPGELRFLMGAEAEGNSMPALLADLVTNLFLRGGGRSKEDSALQSVADSEWPVPQGQASLSDAT